MPFVAQIKCKKRTDRLLLREPLRYSGPPCSADCNTVAPVFHGGTHPVGVLDRITRLLEAHGNEQPAGKNASVRFPTQVRAPPSVPLLPENAWYDLLCRFRPIQSGAATLENST